MGPGFAVLTGCAMVLDGVFSEEALLQRAIKDAMASSFVRNAVVRPETDRKTITRYLGALLLTGLAGGCGLYGSEDKVIQRVPSPSGVLDAAVTIDGGGGATEGPSISVFVVAHGKEPSTGCRILMGQDLASGDGKSCARLSWQGDDRLIVGIAAGRITSYQNFGFARVPSGERFVGVRLDTSFFGPN